MNFYQAYVKVYCGIRKSGNVTLEYEKFVQGCYFGMVIMHKKATWKDKPKATYKVYKRGVVGKNGNHILLTKDAKEKFLWKYVRSKNLLAPRTKLNDEYNRGVLKL